MPEVHEHSKETSIKIDGQPYKISVERQGKYEYLDFKGLQGAGEGLQINEPSDRAALVKLGQHLNEMQKGEHLSNQEAKFVTRLIKNSQQVGGP
jgi:hypothetical protein